VADGRARSTAAFCGEAAMRHVRGYGLILAAAFTLAGAIPALAQQGRPSLRDSFPIGSSGGTLCQVQSRGIDPALSSVFDRAYSMVCRDAAAPIGRMFALRTDAGDPTVRLASRRQAEATCGAPAPRQVDGLRGVSAAECTLTAGNVGYRVYTLRRGKTVYVAEGLAGYESALELGLRTIVADRFVPGEISVATTAAGDRAAFARVQAGSLDIDQAIAEGYRRNNSGSYVEAAEFFNTLAERTDNADEQRRRQGEYLVNRALQKSNLGDFAEADALFAQADRLPTANPVELRLRRNMKVLNFVNQRRLPAAMAELDRPIRAAAAPAEADGATISPTVAAEINSNAPLARQLGISGTSGLTDTEKAAILDAQAQQLRGTVLRLSRDPQGARQALTGAMATLLSIRDGRVTSIARLRGQTMAELSIVDEDAGDYASAERLLRDAVRLLETEYPSSAAVNAAKARLAAYLDRRGQGAASIALYREVVGNMAASGGSTVGFENLLAPYFAVLAREIPTQPGLVDDFFLATETLVRPGVADTQAVLARELSGGSDEAAALFRQSVNLTRDIERNRIEVARLASVEQPSAEDQRRLSLLRTTLSGLEGDQVATLARLSQYPKYRAISTQALTLPDLRSVLKPGEAYLKLAVVGNNVYALYATQAEATAYRTTITAADLEKKVGTLRDSIVKEENGELLTFPFDVKLARELYVSMIGPVSDRMTDVRHLIFEPDGAMLRLPINLLIADQAGLDAYTKRIAKPDADEFDLTGIQWLGRREEVSTAVSARAFRDVRRAAPSAAPEQYLGFGHNAPVSNAVTLASTRSLSGAGGIDCDWPLDQWNKPIAATELNTARSIIGTNTSQVVTGAAFSDTALMARRDLNRFRILHFATHGLVTAPRPECPARPALLTSFGGKTSDGLLSFREIYDLRLDADLVVLSACDTAGKATVAATREAGVTSGGGEALDGLVRAFIGAGGRSVLASHWPAPDSFKATERLITGLFDAKPGTSTAEALRLAQNRLMDDKDTSHPYYWAGFALIGDGDRPVLRSN
jgi:CHAT domain-containing protein